MVSCSACLIKVSAKTFVYEGALDFDLACSPVEMLNLDGETVLVNQVGWGGINVGRVDFQFDLKRFAKKDVMIVQ